MQLGNFSVSLAVKDLARSSEFYSKLGFTQVHGDESQGWVVLRNASCVIGLFQGMFEKNILTFNPGWNTEGEALQEFTDIRALQQGLKARGLACGDEIEKTSSGPASFIIEDPDGNTLLFDQHV